MCPVRNLTTTRVYGMTGAPFVTNITTGASGAVQKLDYVWSKFGHLLNRKSTSPGITPAIMEEKFVYDLVNRLDTAKVELNDNGTDVTVMDLAYDAAGNLTQKIDTTGTKNYTYHATKKHAVTGITGTASQTFAYDPNGNMSSRNSMTQTWNAANLPTTLATSSYTADFDYGPTRARYKQEATYSGRTETTRYVGSLYEKFSRTDQAGIQHRYRVFAYGKPVAQVTDFSASSTRQTRYLHGDHLGSIDAITNEAGTVITDGRMSFDAHGNRRAAMTSQGSAWDALLKYPAQASLIDGNGTTTGLRSVTPRGFTDHEMLDNVGLIHMNGRVYDPAIGRFLSVDPVFQFPENTQSLNPYSYVLNSPLSFTDPTGYTCEAGENTECPSQEAPREKKDWRSLGAHKSNLGAKTGAGTSGVGARTGGEMARDVQGNISLGSRTGGIAASAPNAANRGQGPSDALKKKTDSADTGSAASRPNTDGAAGDLTSPQGAADVGLGVIQGQVNALWEVVALGWEYTVPGLANFVKNNLMFEAGSSEQQFGQDISLGVPLPLGIASTRAGIVAAAEIRAASVATNPIPRELARVVAGGRSVTTLGRAGEADVFVTAAEDIAGLNASQLAQRLAISPAKAFTVIRFPTPVGGGGIASPVSRANSGFLQGGLTRGGAREFVVPNGPIPPGAVIEVVR